MGSQHVKASKTLLKSARPYFFHIFLELWKKISSKNSVLLLSGNLRPFVNILTPNEIYSLSVKAGVERNQFKCNYLEITNFFLIFFRHFRNPHKILNTLGIKKRLNGYLILKL